MHRDDAYSRGDHRLAGYITTRTETDPVRNSQKHNYVLQSQTGNRNTAYSRGDHSSAGYLTGYTETDPVWNSQKSNYYTTGQIDEAYYTKERINTHTV